MRLPLPWFGEYVTLPEGVTGEQVAADLVRVGLEEEAVHGGTVTGPLVVGRVLEFVEEPQKNGKTIRWCQVDVGDPAGPQGIVCGARNFLVGDLVVVIRPGGALGDFVIGARKTYGHVSNGMICSARELGLGEDHDGIVRLTEWGMDDVVPGQDAIALLGLGEETVEINVTPDRGYCFSLRGVAREYSHATGAAFTDPAALDVPAATGDGFAVEVRDDAPIRGQDGCARYVARTVHGVDPNRPAPRWMQRRLEQAGMRPISLAVDVTNYVMLALGQPLHAFDLAQLVAPVVVRRARPGEKLTTLDDVARTLHPEDLLITDTGGDRVLALAGVMGGADTEIGPQTTDVLIEAAWFEPVTVARTSRRHKLSTEASKRFERGVDTALAPAAAELAVQLLVEHGGGTPGPVTDLDDTRAPQPVALDPELPARLVGVDYAAEQVVQTLTMIGCTVAQEGATLSVTPPTWRPDLVADVDLVEEVARLRGYDAIPSLLPAPSAGAGLTTGQRGRRSLARALAEHGLTEVLSYPFVADDAELYGLPEQDERRALLRLVNPLSDEAPYLRSWLLPTLLETARRNLGRGAADLAVFEIGLVTRAGTGSPTPVPRLDVGQRPTAEELAQIRASVPEQPRHVAAVLAGQRELRGWNSAGRPVDWADAVAVARLVCATLGVEPQVSAGQTAPWHPGRCAVISHDGRVLGHAGELHPALCQSLGLPARTCALELELDALLAGYQAQPVAAAALSTFPLAKEDVALVVDATVPAAQVQAALAEGAGELLESVRLFDVYTGEQVGQGRQSLAFALRLRAPDRTLTAKETAAVREAAVAAAAAATGAELRGA